MTLDSIAAELLTDARAYLAAVEPELANERGVIGRWLIHRAANLLDRELPILIRGLLKLLVRRYGTKSLVDLLGIEISPSDRAQLASLPPVA